MDPQKLSQLDPKLRDAYQRVMGTVIPEPQVPAAQTQTPTTPPAPPTPPTLDPIPAPKPQPIPQPEPIQTPVAEPAPTIQEPSPTPITPPAEIPPAIPQPVETLNSEVTASAPTAGNLNFTAPIQTQTTTVKKKNGKMLILFGIVGLTFIVVYALFWAKIFNFKLF